MAVKKDQLYAPVAPFVTEEGNFGMDARVTGAWLARMSAKIPGFEALWKPIEATVPDVEKATAAPGEKRGED